VVGAGGAGFPTWKKIDARVETVIVNGAECEPLLRNDQQVLAARTGEVVRGLVLTMASTGASRGVIALKKKYTAAIAALKKEIRDQKDISLHLLESVYPAGDEFVLVYEVTGKVIPPGEIPLKVGVLVSNVETFANISAAERGDPVISRCLTVTGAVREPKTLTLPIGISLKAAVADVQIKTIGKVTEKRNRNAALYDAGLSDLGRSVVIPLRRPEVRQAFHTYVIQVEKRDELIAFLAERGVETKIHYPIPIHLMEACRGYGYRQGDFPVAEGQAGRIISLPVHHHLSAEQIDYVIESVRRFYR